MQQHMATHHRQQAHAIRGLQGLQQTQAPRIVHHKGPRGKHAVDERRVNVQPVVAAAGVGGRVQAPRLERACVSVPR